MANNIKGGAPNAIVAKSTVSFTTAGITSGNTEIIYLVDDPLKSYVPGRAINGISGFVADSGYYLVAKTDMDLSAYVVPPLGDILPLLSAPGSFAATAASSSQINLTWTAPASATGYVVERATNSGFTTGVATIYTGAALLFNDTSLTPLTNYWYRIHATATGFVDSAYATANTSTLASSYTPVKAPAYVTALTGAGSTVPSGHQTAFNAFESTLESIGMLAKMKQLLLYYGDNLPSSMIDFMGTVNGTSIGGTQTPTGISLNGTGDHVNLNFSPFVHQTVNNLGKTLKVKNSIAPGIFGGFEIAGSENPLVQIAFNTDGTHSLFAAGSINDVFSMNNPLDYSKIMTVVRRSTTDQEVYIDGASVGTSNTPVATPLPNVFMFGGARNFNGTTDGYSANTVQLDAHHDGATTIQIQGFHTAIKTLFTAIGR